MFNLNIRRPIGLDIGQTDVYAAQIQEGRGKFLVRELMQVKIAGPSDDEALGAALREIAANENFSGKRAVAHLPSQDIFSFPLSFQINEGEGLEEAILRESMEFLPFPVEEAVLDYPSVVAPSDGGDGEYRATVVAARRADIEHYLTILARAGFVVEAVDFQVSSLIRLHNYLHESGRDPIVLCNVGGTRSQVSVVTRDNILAQLGVNWGTERLIQKVQVNLGLGSDERQARILLKNYGLVYEDPESFGQIADEESKDTGRIIHQLLIPLVEELVYELHKITGYVRAEEDYAFFDGMYLYGQAALIRGLEHYLAKRLNLRTESVNPLEKFSPLEGGDWPDLAEGPPFALALGLAMRTLRWL